VGQTMASLGAGNYRKDPTFDFRLARQQASY
jgi:hypothetical protein